MLVPDRANARWSLDFLSDTISDGRRFRVLVDDYTRECLALVADTSLSGLRVARELDGVIRLRGRPDTIVSGNGAEFTSMAILRWGQQTGVAWHYIALASRRRTPSSRASTGVSGTSAATTRCSRRSQSAHSAITSWKEDYNRHRPYSAFGNMTPAEFALKSSLEKQAA